MPLFGGHLDNPIQAVAFACDRQLQVCHVQHERDKVLQRSELLAPVCTQGRQMRQCDGLARSGLPDDNQVPSTGECLAERESRRPIYSGKLGPGRHVRQRQCDCIFGPDRATRFHSGRGGQEPRLNSNLVEREKGGCQVHSLGTAQCNASMILLNGAHPPGLRLLPPVC